MSCLESWAWKYFLPASLILGLLGSGVNTKSDKVEKGWGNSAVISFPLLISFMIGVLGSLLSGAATCKLVHLFYGETVSNSVRGVICCLTASYIGGTMNFFVRLR